MGMGVKAFVCLICKKKNNAQFHLHNKEWIKRHFSETHTDVPKSKWSKFLIQKSEPVTLISVKKEPKPAEADVIDEKVSSNSEKPSMASTPPPALVEFELVEAWEAIRQLLGKKEDNENDIRRQLAEKQAKLQSLEEKLNQMNTDLGAAQDLILNYDVDRAMLQEENQKLRAELADRQRKCQDDLKQAGNLRTSAMAELTQANEKMKEQDREKTALQTVLLAIRGQLHELQSKRELEQSHVHSQKVSMERELAQAREDVKALEMDLERSRRLCKRKDEDRERLEGENGNLRKKLKTIIVNVGKITV